MEQSIDGVRDWVVKQPLDSGEWPPPDGVDEVLACGIAIDWQAAFLCDVGWCWDRNGLDAVGDTATHWHELAPHPTGGGIGARSVARPKETVEDFMHRYCMDWIKAASIVGDLSCELEGMPSPGAATQDDMDRLVVVLAASEAAEAVMDAGISSIPRPRKSTDLPGRL